MTPGMLVLMLLAGWLMIAVAAGKFTYRFSGKRWARWLAVLVVIALPFWDVPFGVYRYKKAVRELAGVRIYRHVEAEGYLDRAYLATMDSSLGGLRCRGYEYVEIEVRHVSPLLPTLFPEQGYYQVTFGEGGSPECAEFDSLPDAERFRARYGLGRECVMLRRSDVPISRYEYESSLGWRAHDRPAVLPPIYVSWQRVRDRVTGEVIGEAYRVGHKFWIERVLHLSGRLTLSDPAGVPLYLDVTEVVRRLKNSRTRKGTPIC